MMVGATKIRIDENEADKFNKVKKLAVTTADKTKRAALGDLQNRGVLRQPANGKEAIKKESIGDIKLQNALRTTKARVDSHWKKQPAVGTTHKSESGSSEINAAAVQKRQVLTRTNSLRVKGPTTTTSTTTTLTGMQRLATLHQHAATQQNKTKTVTTKVVETKVQHVKYITKTRASIEEKTKKLEPAIKREDSNLSRKSLTKLKAALSGKSVTASGKTAAVAKTNPSDKVKTDSVVVEQQIIQNANSEIKIVSVQTHSAQLINAVEDIDAEDGDNLVLVSEYVNDIYDYLYNLEDEQPIQRDHLAGQLEISARMRSVLLDWINEVHLQFHLAPETFQMAVAIIDRYLQTVKNTKRTHMQLVGVTALFVAAKYEELYPPAIADFVYITDNAYTTKQILQMELKIFKTLDCNFSRPLPIHFLRRFSKAAKVEDEHHSMSKYFLELAAIEYNLASYKPSEIAAASLFLALHLLNDKACQLTGFNNKHWTPTLEWYSHYSPRHLRPIARKIAVVVRDAPKSKLQAAYTKYQSSKLHKVSLRKELSGALLDSIIHCEE